MRLYLLLLLGAAGCQPAGDNATAPAEPAAVGSAQSGAEGQAMADEQLEAANQAGASNDAGAQPAQ